MKSHPATRFILGAASLTFLAAGLSLEAVEKAGRPSKKSAPVDPPVKVATGGCLFKWTSTDGRSLTAYWLRLEKDAVVLKLENGRMVQIPLSSLAPESQAAARLAAKIGVEDAPAYDWTVFAGKPNEKGGADGSVKDARFHQPSGIVIDPAGNLFIAECENNTIRKISASGEVTTVAGKAGAKGATDGEGATARFYHPVDITIDADGNLYVAEFVNAIIRKITPSGMVSTVAGTTKGKGVHYGSTDGKGSEAKFFFPNAIAVDGKGRLFVSDWENATIRMITPDGNVTTFAGKVREAGYADGAGAAARFSGVKGLTMDVTGHLFAVENGNSCIRKITPAGEVSTFAGKAGQMGSVDGMGAEARFYLCNGITSDALGNLYVIEQDKQDVRKVAPDARVSRIGGMGNALTGAAARDSGGQTVFPKAIAVSADGTLYVTDFARHVIYRGVPTSSPKP